MATQRLPMAPAGQAEYDFCQMMGPRPRVSAREVNGRYELYTVNSINLVAVLFSSDSWSEVYLKGRELAGSRW